MTPRFGIALVVLLAATIPGCDEEDPRVVQVARESLARQAEQNLQMARQSEHVAKASQQLVAAQQTLQTEAQQERQSLDRQFAALEAERKAIAAARYWDPLLAGALTWSATLLACLVPLALTGYLIHASYNGPHTSDLSELLVTELTSDTPALSDRPLLALDPPAAEALLTDDSPPHPFR